MYLQKKKKIHIHFSFLLLLFFNRTELLENLHGLQPGYKSHLLFEAMPLTEIPLKMQV